VLSLKMSDQIHLRHLSIPIITAHAALGTIAWGFVFPLGAVLFALNRYPSSSRLKPKVAMFWTHTTIQTLGVAIALANFGLGIKIGLKYDKLYNNPHTCIGMVVNGLLVFQPIWGATHHSIHRAQLRKKSLKTESGNSSEEKDIEIGSERSRINSTASREDEKQRKGWGWFGLLHRWLGRVIITLAMIDGGLGFRLAYRPVFSYVGEVVYSVLVACMFVVWQGFVFGGFWKRRQEARKMRKGDEGPRVTIHGAE
jgi:hypothetical protein